MSSNGKTNLYVTCHIRQADGTTVCKYSGSMEKTIEKMKEAARVYGSAPLILE